MRRVTALSPKVTDHRLSDEKIENIFAIIDTVRLIDAKSEVVRGGGYERGCVRCKSVEETILSGMRGSVRL